MGDWERELFFTLFAPYNMNNQEFARRQPITVGVHNVSEVWLRLYGLWISRINSGVGAQ